MQVDNTQLHEELQDLRDDFRQHLEQDARNFSEIKEALWRIEECHKDIKERQDSLEKKLDPVVDAYKAILFNKSFLTGLGGVVVAITAIGGALYWLLTLKH